MSNLQTPSHHRPVGWGLPAWIGGLLGLMLIGGVAWAEGDSDIDQMIRRSAIGAIVPHYPVKTDLSLTADRTDSWHRTDGRVLLLDGNVRIGIGTYGFTAKRAVVFLTDLSIPGRKAKRLAVYLDQVSELGGWGPISQEAPRLLVTATFEGKTTLQTNLLRTDPADDDELVRAATARLQNYELAVRDNVQPVPGGPTPFAVEARRPIEPVPPEAPTPPVPAVPELAPPAPPTVAEAPEPAAPHVPAAPEVEGDIRYTCGKLVYSAKQHAVLLMDDIHILWHDPIAKRSLTLRADKAVIFVDPDADDASPEAGVLASQVRGIYLEDNVIASDGQYTLRGPRMFYDLARNQALVLDAVFYTWDVKRKIPIYVRAQKLRQESLNQWSAHEARLTTSAFFQPHFAIGMKDLTIRQTPDRKGDGQINFEAKGTTFRVGDTPIFYWPKLAGPATDVPLRSFEIGGNSNDGAVVQSRWDLFGLLGAETPQGLDADLLLDGRSKRGPAVGINTTYDVPKAYGLFESYFLYDKGEDEPGGRNDIHPETDTRAKLLWRHRHLLPDDWELTAEVAYLSDPTFLEEFFRNEAYADKPYESLLYLKKQRDDWAFTFLAKYDLLDFVPQMDVLQTRGNIMGTPGGYTTEKLPEIAYHRIGTSLLDDRITWFSENRASVMRLSLPDRTPGQLAFSPAQSMALFGIAATTWFDNAQRMAGIDDNTRYRADTRQELQLPLQLNLFESVPIDAVPYVVGRFTAYDDNFALYSGETDNSRLWGATGVKLHTAISGTYDDVESRAFDLHRLRHIIEPSVHAFFAETSLRQDSLPVFDYDVESLAEGAMVRLGLRNTLQTQRGGPGRWQSVDFFRIDTDFVIASDETHRESFIPQFFDYRPEMSLVGDHFYSEAAWQVTDTLSAAGDVTYSFDRSEVEQWDIGITMEHTPRFNTYAQVRTIDVLDAFIALYGFEYMLTPKYHATFSQAFDIDRGRNRNTTLMITRRMPRWLLMVVIDYDTVGDTASFGVALAPEGVGGAGKPARNPFLATQY